MPLSLGPRGSWGSWFPQGVYHGGRCARNSDTSPLGGRRRDALVSITVTGPPGPRGAGLFLGLLELSTVAPATSHSSSGCGLARTSVFNQAHTAGKLTSVRAYTKCIAGHASTCLYPSGTAPNHHHIPQPSQGQELLFCPLQTLLFDAQLPHPGDWPDLPRLPLEGERAVGSPLWPAAG